MFEEKKETGRERKRDIDLCTRKKNREGHKISIMDTTR